MKAIAAPKQFEFNSQQPENYFLVENRDDGVVDSGCPEELLRPTEERIHQRARGRRLHTGPFQWFLRPGRQQLHGG